MPNQIAAFWLPNTIDSLPLNTSTKFLSIRSNCRILKSDSLRMDLEPLVLLAVGISIFFPWYFSPMMFVVNT